jgi:hypothetical protein
MRVLKLVSSVHVETTILCPVPMNEYQELRPDTSPPLQLLKVVREPFSFVPVVTDPSTGSGPIASSQLWPDLEPGGNVGRDVGEKVKEESVGGLAAVGASVGTSCGLSIGEDAVGICAGDGSTDEGAGSTGVGVGSTG